MKVWVSSFHSRNDGMQIVVDKPGIARWLSREFPVTSYMLINELGDTEKRPRNFRPFIRRSLHANKVEEATRRFVVRTKIREEANARIAAKAAAKAIETLISVHTDRDDYPANAVIKSPLVLTD